jgi:hypothetical protein
VSGEAELSFSDVLPAMLNAGFSEKQCAAILREILSGGEGEDREDTEAEAAVEAAGRDRPWGRERERVRDLAERLVESVRVAVEEVAELEKGRREGEEECGATPPALLQLQAGSSARMRFQVDQSAYSQQREGGAEEGGAGLRAERSDDEMEVQRLTEENSSLASRCLEVPCSYKWALVLARALGVGSGRMRVSG